MVECLPDGIGVRKGTRHDYISVFHEGNSDSINKLDVHFLKETRQLFQNRYFHGKLSNVTGKYRIYLFF